MKKITKISPLKIFNDAYAARVKKVNDGGSTVGVINNYNSPKPKYGKPGTSYMATTPAPAFKPGGPIKSKSIEVHKEGWKNDTIAPITVKAIKPKPTGIYDYKTGQQIVYTTAGPKVSSDPKVSKKHGGSIKSKKK